MTARPLHTALIGFGRMGQIYARVIDEQLDDAVLYAIADPALEEDDAQSVRHSVAHILHSAEEVFGLPDLDAVVIASPTRTHAEFVVQAAQAGIAIFCEKPLALSREATLEALAAVEAAGVLLQVGFMRRFDESYQRARDELQTGRIGKPLVFKAIGRDPGCPDPSFADPTTSGGLILDMAIHDFDLARWLMGSEIETVSATGGLLVCQRLQDVSDIDNAVINLRFANGALGNIEISRNAVYGYDIRTEVLGEKGVVQIGKPLSDSMFSIRTESDSHDDGVKRGHYLVQRFHAAYRAQIQHFVASVRSGHPPMVTGRDAQAAFEAALAATYSARTQQPVSLSAIQDGWTSDEVAAPQTAGRFESL